MQEDFYQEDSAPRARDGLSLQRRIYDRVIEHAAMNVRV